MTGIVSTERFKRTQSWRWERESQVDIRDHGKVRVFKRNYSGDPRSQCWENSGNQTIKGDSRAEILNLWVVTPFPWGCIPRILDIRYLQYDS